MTKTKDDLRWVACGQDASYAASLHRHLIRGKVHTTLCGASASFPEVWRGNSTKPVCPECAKAQIAALEVAISE